MIEGIQSFRQHTIGPDSLLHPSTQRSVEIVFFDRRGISRFQLLQRRELYAGLRPVFAVFDCLGAEGKEILTRPLIDSRIRGQSGKKSVFRPGMTLSARQSGLEIGNTILSGA